MKLTIEELTKGISKFLEYFLFELADQETLDYLEGQLKNILESEYVQLFDYKLRSMILDKTTLRVNLQFDNNNIDFYLGEAYYE